MAQRKSAREIAAREKARERAAKPQERERKLEDLATRFFLVQDEIESIEAAAAKKIAAYTERVRNDAEKRKRDLRAKRGTIIGEMLDSDGVRSVAYRLDVPEGDVRDVKASRSDEPPLAVPAGGGSLGKASKSEAGRAGTEWSAADGQASLEVRSVPASAGESPTTG